MAGFSFGNVPTFSYTCSIHLLVSFTTICNNIMSPRKQQKLDQFYLRALDELFRRVGFDGYDKEFTNQQWWYTLREWTLEEDLNFTQWFTDEYRKAFRCSKYIAKGAASMFVFNYGWKVKQENQTVAGFKR